MQSNWQRAIDAEWPFIQAADGQQHEAWPGDLKPHHLTVDGRLRRVASCRIKEADR